MPEDQKKKHSVSVRLTDEERQALAKIAEPASISAYLRKLIVRHIRRKTQK